MFVSVLPPLRPLIFLPLPFSSRPSLPLRTGARLSSEGVARIDGFHALPSGPSSSSNRWSVLETIISPIPSMSI